MQQFELIDRTTRWPDAIMWIDTFKNIVAILEKEAANLEEVKAVKNELDTAGYTTFWRIIKKLDLIKDARKDLFEKIADEYTKLRYMKVVKLEDLPEELTPEILDILVGMITIKPSTEWNTICTGMSQNAINQVLEREQWYRDEIERKRVASLTQEELEKEKELWKKTGEYYRKGGFIGNMGTPSNLWEARFLYGFFPPRLEWLEVVSNILTDMLGTDDILPLSRRINREVYDTNKNAPDVMYKNIIGILNELRDSHKEFFQKIEPLYNELVKQGKENGFNF